MSTQTLTCLPQTKQTRNFISKSTGFHVMFFVRKWICSVRSLARCNSPLTCGRYWISLSALGLSNELPFNSSCFPGVATPELMGKWSCLHAATLGSVNTEEPLPFSFGKTIQVILLLFKASFKGLSLQKQLLVPQLSSCTTPTSLRNSALINSGTSCH